MNDIIIIINELFHGHIVKSFINSCRGATPPSFNIHSPAVAPCAFPYGMPIVAVPTVGFWLNVGFLAALGLVAAWRLNIKNSCRGVVPPSEGGHSAAFKPREIPYRLFIVVFGTV